MPPFAEALQSGRYHIKWTTCSDLPTPMYATYVAVSNGTIYCTGTTRNKDNQHDVYCYDTRSDQWKQMPRPGHCLGVLHMVDEKLTIFGGKDPYTGRHLDKVTTYDSETDIWYPYYPSMLHKRYKPGVITSSNHVIVMGGKSTPYIDLNSIEVMNYHHQLQWKEVSIHLPVPMFEIKPTISGDYITIVGYHTTNGDLDSEFCRNGHYQISTEEIISSLDQPLSTGAVARQWKVLSAATHWETATVPYSNPPVIIGGISLVNQGDAHISLYDSSKNSWKKVNSLTSAKYDVGVALLNKNTIVVIGGFGSGSSSLATVEIGNIVPNQ